MLMTYQFGDKFHKLDTLPRVEEIALHETLHGFLHGLIEAAKTHQTEHIAAVEHGVINVLVNLLLNPQSTETK